MQKQTLSRRDFIKLSSQMGALFGGAGLILQNPLLSHLFGYQPENLLASGLQNELIRNAPRARFWISTVTKGVNCLSCHTPEEAVGTSHFEHEEKYVRCLLCAQNCLIKEGQRGRCRTRININGELRSLVYGRPITVHIDPIEKKPFFHFLPGSQALSLATSGCPLSCKFCQNWEISQARPEDYSVKFTPAEAIADTTTSKSVPVIAFTYNEPTVFTEYLVDIAREAKKQDLRSVLVSCGFMNHDPLAEMCEVLDAIKIDLKGFSPDFYRKVCSAELKPVLRSIKQVAKSGKHLEIVNLVVPTLNDSEKMLNGLAEWIIGEIGPDVPIHFTRFHPDYKLLNLPPTPIATLERAREIAMTKGIHYAYVGNVPGHEGNNTYCPSCKRLIIQRSGIFILNNFVEKGRCKYCKQKIAGVFN